MKVYKVKVNGKVYEVEVESVTESNATITTPSKAPVTEEKKYSSCIKWCRYRFKSSNGWYYFRCES